MARNCSETVVQLDGQEQPPAETEQRRVIVEAVRKFSSLAKSSASRAGKPFFPVLTKSPRPMLRPWPSAANISRPVQISSIPTPIPTSAVIEAGDPWRKDSFRSLHSRPSLEDSEGRLSVSSQGEKNQEGVVNSAFAEEKVDDISDICDCDDMGEDDDGSWSDPSHRSQCRQVFCQQSWTPEMIDMSVIGGEPSHSSIKTSSKYLITRRDRSVSDSRKKKGIHWRPRLSGKSLKFRRRTTDSIPSVTEVLSQTWSSPNLKDLEEQAKITQSVKVDPCKQEEDSKL